MWSKSNYLICLRVSFWANKLLEFSTEKQFLQIENWVIYYPIKETIFASQNR